VDDDDVRFRIEVGGGVFQDLSGTGVFRLEGGGGVLEVEEEVEDKGFFLLKRNFIILAVVCCLFLFCFVLTCFVFWSVVEMNEVGIPSSGLLY